MKSFIHKLDPFFRFGAPVRAGTNRIPISIRELP